MNNWIKAKIWMYKHSSNLEELGIDVNDPVGNLYNVDINLKSIGAILEVPDGEGIPDGEYAKINVYGIEYVINYPINKLKELVRNVQ